MADTRRATRMLPEWRIVQLKKIMKDLTPRHGLFLDDALQTVPAFKDLLLNIRCDLRAAVQALLAECRQFKKTNPIEETYEEANRRISPAIQDSLVWDLRDLWLYAQLIGSVPRKLGHIQLIYLDKILERIKVIYSHRLTDKQRQSVEKSEESFLHAKAKILVTRKLWPEANTFFFDKSGTRLKPRLQKFAWSYSLGMECLLLQHQAEAVLELYQDGIAEGIDTIVFRLQAAKAFKDLEQFDSGIKALSGDEGHSSSTNLKR